MGPQGPMGNLGGPNEDEGSPQPVEEEGAVESATEEAEESATQEAEPEKVAEETGSSGEDAIESPETQK